MSWRAKHLYSALVVVFLLYSGIGFIFCPSILTRYWPVLIPLYLLSYLGLPLLRKLSQKNLENPSLQKIADIMNEALKEIPPSSNLQGEIDPFVPDNAYVRLVNDYIFREYTSDKVYDRIKDSIANCYFYYSTGWALGVVGILSALGLVLNLVFFLSQGRFLVRPLFTGLSPQMLAVTWFALIFILGGLSCWGSFYFRSDVAEAEKRRAQNLYMFLIVSRKNEIAELVQILNKDKDLLAIACGKKLRVPQVDFLEGMKASLSLSGKVGEAKALTEISSSGHIGLVAVFGSSGHSIVSEGEKQARVFRDTEEKWGGSRYWPGSCFR